MSNQYDDIYQRSLNQPDAFWQEAAKNIHWYKQWDTVLETTNKPFYRWFVGGELNTLLQRG